MIVGNTRGEEVVHRQPAEAPVSYTEYSFASIMSEKESFSGSAENKETSGLNRRDFLRASVFSAMSAAIGTPGNVDATEHSPQPDGTALMLDLLHTADSSENIIKNLNRHLEAAQAPQPLLQLIHADILAPMQKRNNTLTGGLAGLPIEKIRSRREEAKKNLEESKEMAGRILGTKWNEIVFDEKKKKEQVTHAIQWACNYSADTTVDKEFRLYTQLFNRTEKIQERITILDNRIHALQTFEKNEQVIEEKVQEFQQKGWNREAMEQFRTAVKLRLTSEIELWITGRDFLKKLQASRNEQ